MNPAMPAQQLPVAPPLDLRPPALPAEIDWWPPAPGWWLLLIGLLLLILLGWWLQQRYRRLALKRAALRELRSLQTRFETGESANVLVAELSILLRRVVISLPAYRGRGLEGLSGEAWLAFLDQPLAGDPFRQGVGRVLLTAPYMPQTELELGELLALSQRWLKSLPWLEKGAVR